jgi:hypothetical protein
LIFCKTRTRSGFCHGAGTGTTNTVVSEVLPE